MLRVERDVDLSHWMTLKEVSQGPKIVTTISRPNEHVY